MGYEVEFLPVGDGERSGDAIVLRFGNLDGSRGEQTVVVVDGGFADTGQEVVNHIKRFYGTDQIDLVISTHPDGDHSAGLVKVLEQLKVKRLWMHQPWDHTDDIAKMFKDGRVTDESIEKRLRESLNTAKNLE
jgi:beta-lactamase superfamily II metal-dependent hydrolase